MYIVADEHDIFDAVKVLPCNPQQPPADQLDAGLFLEKNNNSSDLFV